MMSTVLDTLQQLGISVDDAEVRFVHSRIPRFNAVRLNIFRKNPGNVVGTGHTTPSERVVYSVHCARYPTATGYQRGRR